jgi:hypothetical protein
MFQRYEDEFGELASEIGQKLKKVEAEPMTRDDAEEAMDSVDGLLTELRTVTRSMEMGKRDVPGSERAACERRLQEYQKDLERLNAEARRVRRAATNRQGRQDLLGDGDGISDEARRRSEQTRSLLDVAERGRSSLQRVRCPAPGVIVVVALTHAGWADHRAHRTGAGSRWRNWRQLQARASPQSRISVGSASSSSAPRTSSKWPIVI